MPGPAAVCVEFAKEFAVGTANRRLTVLAMSLLLGLLADVGRAASDQELAKRMNDWIKRKGRLPTQQDLKVLGPTFRKAWNAYKGLRQKNLTKPTDEEYRLARQMWEWIRKHARQPNAGDLRNATLRQQWAAYRKVNDYEGIKKEERIEEGVADAKAQCRKANDCFKRGDYRDAIRLFRRLLRNEYAKPVHKEIDAKLDEIGQVGMAELEKVKPLVEAKEYREAMDAYAKVATTFKGLPASEQALDRWASLELDPSVKKTIHLRRARELMDLGDDALQAKRYLEAKQYYRHLAVEYAHLALGKEAGEKLAAMRDNKQIKPTVQDLKREREIDRLLAAADMAEKSGLIDKAIEHLRTLAETYPDTVEARAARKRIERLRQIR